MATREVTSEFMGGIVTEVEVKLPADYIVEINEHIPDYRVLRLKEYPAIADCIVAILENMEGRPQALNDLLEYRQEIKNKYPKPINDLK
jgi:hypothetical protein